MKFKDLLQEKFRGEREENQYNFNFPISKAIKKFGEKYKVWNKREVIAFMTTVIDDYLIKKVGDKEDKEKMYKMIQLYSDWCIRHVQEDYYPYYDQPVTNLLRKYGGERKVGPERY